MGSGGSRSPLIWADLRREGPISAYVAATDWIVGTVEHPAGQNAKRRQRREWVQVGRETWAIAGRQIMCPLKELYPGPF
jgi:hypothetical protein